MSDETAVQQNDESGVTDESPVHHSTGDPPATDREFGWQGWVLVAAVLVSFLGIPLLIYLNARNVVAIPFRFAFLVLPLVPAVLLAVLAVWVTTTE